ncbi:MAG: ATP-binding protein [Deltaproteobacteria bacterium]|nr:ATP-binding protein [Deltaproteobacteria bacterium]
MSRKHPWTPWHKVVALRDDVRTGELALATFAADLYDVAMGQARPVYQDRVEFFALTYPTFNLRELAKDVCARLAGKDDKAVRQLELTYGGGKTHTLITLYHLVQDPDSLPGLPAVAEFVSHAGRTPPKSRIAALCFDKLDVEKGMEVRAPDGSRRWLRHPWSVLAWQLAGADGLRLLHPDDRDEERDSAPAENLLVPLLARPAAEGLATLVLLDEVLMFAREKVGLDPAWQGRLAGFFQYLTQAATKVTRCAIVASLLATDPRKMDALGKAIVADLQGVFRRETEQGVQPVLKEDVAEVLRRRFFTPASIQDRSAFRPHVTAALQGIGGLDEATKHDGAAAEERFVRSFPFHPDLTEVFYTKWTNLESFQRTRGVLRTFARALRHAETWDESPIVSLSAFLPEPGKGGLSEAAAELCSVARAEEYEGRRHEWVAILEGEVEKAREIQKEHPGLHHREAEQAVLATFLHSQPVGQKAVTRDLLVLVGATRPDRIELEKALGRWADTSWFLDETGNAETGDGVAAVRPLPKTWRLGSKPNLRQMHHDAIQQRVKPDLVEQMLIDEVAGFKALTTGAAAAGAKVHVLPVRPADVGSDGDFHYVVLGQKAASRPGQPSPEARRYLEEKTSKDHPRTNPNAVLLVTPSPEGLDAARARVREYLGWVEVGGQFKDQPEDPLRAGMLGKYVETAKKTIPDAVRQAWCVVVTMSAKGETEAFRVTVGAEPLFETVKADPRSRIQESEVNAEAMLPGGPYDLWREDEPARFVKDLVGAFAQQPRLPKMLRPQAAMQTVRQGCEAGLFALRLKRPDGSVATWWMEAPDESALKDPAIEALLPSAAELTRVPGSLLVPGRLPGLWSSSTLTAGAVRAYFGGSRVMKVPRGGYDEPFFIPTAAPAVVDAAIGEAVAGGKLWLTSGPGSILGEEVPPGMLTADAVLQGPPEPIPPLDLMPETLPAAWGTDTTSALALLSAVSAKRGLNLPWATVRTAITGALNAHLLERAAGTWPCPLGGAQDVKLRRAQSKPAVARTGGETARPNSVSAHAELDIAKMQDLFERIPDLGSAALGCDLKFDVTVRVTGSGKAPPNADVVAKVQNVLGAISDAFKVG